MESIKEDSFTKEKILMDQQNLNLDGLLKSINDYADKFKSTTFESFKDRVSIPIKNGDKCILVNGEDKDSVIFLDDHENYTFKSIEAKSNLNNFNHNYQHIIVFSEPVYVKNIQLSLSSEYEGYELNSGFILDDGEKCLVSPLKTKQVFNDGSRQFSYDCNSLVYGFVFNLPVTFDSAMVIFPFRTKTFEEINELFQSFDCMEEKTYEVNQLCLDAVKVSRNMLNHRQDTLNQVTSHIDSLLLERDRLSQFIEQDEKLLNAAKSDLTDTRKLIEEEIVKFERLSSELVEVKEKLNKDSLSLSDLKIEVEKYDDIKLANDKNQSIANEQLSTTKDKIIKANTKLDTYTLDLDGHLTECSEQLKRYSVYSLTLIAFLAIIFLWLTTSGVEMVHTFNSTPNISVGQLLLSRLPLITATALIIGTISVVLYFFVNHIISLNKERMNMLKASILAQQVSVALANECDLTPEQRKEESKKIKIELMMKLFEDKDEKSKVDAKELSTLTQFAEIMSKLNK